MDRSPALAGNRRARWLLVLFLGLLGFFTWQRLVRGAPPEELRLAGEVMGTTWSARIPVRGDEVPDAGELARAIQAELDAVDRAMSTYKTDSELSRFNRHESTEPFPVSAATRDVFRIAAEVSERSGGALDVTVAPLVALWGFGAGARVPGEPSPTELASVRERVDWRGIRIDDEAGTIAKTNPLATCDLSAVAKGHALDLAAAALMERDVSDFLLELGGELRARGRRPDGGAWRAGIERPDAMGRAVMESLALEDAALATSGDYRNYYEEDGVRRSHLLDPRTGRPIEHGLASVSVLHADAAHADAWATALSVLGPDDGLRVAAEQDLEVHLVIRVPDGTFESRSTPGLESRLRSRP